MFHFKKRKAPPLKITAACGCNVGLVRDNNEDNLCFNGIVLPHDNLGLEDTLYYCASPSGPVHFAVFDGMGGESFGELASFLAASELRNLTGTISEDTLTDTLLRANEEICETTRRHECKLIGTTAAILTILSNSAYITNIGDSRVYRVRGGALEQLSTDHCDGDIGDKYRATTRKPRLTQHLGIEPEEMIIEPAVRVESILPGDRFLICSDGLTDMVPDDDIAAVLTADDFAPGRAVDRLIPMALENGGKDNVTVITVAIS